MLDLTNVLLKIASEVPGIAALLLLVTWFLRHLKEMRDADREFSATHTVILTGVAEKSGVALDKNTAALGAHAVHNSHLTRTITALSTTAAKMEKTAERMESAATRSTPSTGAAHA